jgi:hypothetical protein
MDHLLYPGRDPLAPIEFMATAKRLTFVLKFTDGWQALRYQLLQVFNERLTGMFEILLGDEALLTDESAEFVIYVEPEEQEKAEIILQFLTKP